jgi:glycosyltransferase involved in cell wall biosynthesis
MPFGKGLASPIWSELAIVLDPRSLLASGILDVFIDLSTTRLANSPSLQTLIERWSRLENLGAIARQVTGVVAAGTLSVDPLRLLPGWTFTESPSPLTALSAALATAGRDRVPLLLLIGPVDVNNESIGILRQHLIRDPMVGFAVPRIGCSERCCFARLSQHGLGATEWLPRRILAELPEAAMVVETAAPCILIAPAVLGNFGPLDAQFEDVAAAMLQFMATGRRCGFRTTLVNRVLVGVNGLSCKSGRTFELLRLSARDKALLDKAVPDFERCWEEFRAGSWECFENLCTVTTVSPRVASRPSLLVDARNVSPMYNGTAQAVLGLASALKELKSGWDVAILANPAGAGFHNLSRVYAGWTVYTALPERPFTAALRPSQPWHIQEMADLHRLSLFNTYLFLDTIAWDVGYLAPPHLEGIWSFLADHADALLFDSEFTRQRFVERFPSASSMPSTVTYFSFDPNEYAKAEVVNTRSDEEFILVIGNSLDHKDVKQTVEALTSGFPFRRIKVLGPTTVVSPFVTAKRSGEIAELELHRLYANAQYVVFPSFYEGFGFPIITALAYGRTVLARRSTLLDELAARCDRHRGRLVAFDRREELVELIGRLMYGNPVREEELGSAATNGRPKTWHDVARETVGFLEELVREPSRSRWIAREHAIRQFLSCRT